MKIISSSNIDTKIYQAFVAVFNKTNVLALPTGNTPLKFYKKITNASLNWKNITIFMLDCWYPQDRNDLNSFYSYIERNLLSKINLPKENFHILNSAATNPEKECEKYEQEIKKAGELDLAILGLGQDGHIGFNEPGTPENSLTHLAKLTEQTLNDNGNLAHITCGLTMGIKTILSAKKIFLLAKGLNKAPVVKKALEGPISLKCPASFLQKHPDCTFFLDREAASLL
ncbi:MAG: glucosamine-6-phosphate deaminase [Patescibacteria group bacterium]|nr:glucosamine-6-phosphate deaminase [Patescibacteria group bacterium]